MKLPGGRTRIVRGTLPYLGESRQGPESYNVEGSVQLLKQRMTKREVLPQAKKSNGRRKPLRQHCHSIPNQRDLFHVGAAISAGDQMQVDANLGHDREAIVEMLGGAISHIVARQSAGHPAGGMVVHSGASGDRGLNHESPQEAESYLYFVPSK